MHNFVDRLTRIEQIITQLQEQVADIEETLWDGPLIDHDEPNVESVVDGDTVQLLKQRLAQVELEINNINSPGKNIIQFPISQGTQP